MKVKIGISNRHIHLTEEAYRLLFEKNLTKKCDLVQPGQFAAQETLTIENNGEKIENVRIIGPFRKYNQIEISARDAKKLGINPPVRTSGDLSNAVDLVVTSDKGSFKLKNCCILANRHIHIGKKLAESLRLKDNQEVNVRVNGDKGGLLKTFIKISDNGVLEMHIDTDDAYSLGLNNGDEVDLII
jgi:putative phosphotransacetylase